MSEPPYVPFYKPYGMSDEEYEYEVRIAEAKFADWQEQQYQQQTTPHWMENKWITGLNASYPHNALYFVSNNVDCVFYVQNSIEAARLAAELNRLSRPVTDAEIIELSEELWDKHSESIDDDSYSFQRVAGTSVLTKEDYQKLITDLRDKLNKSTP